MNEVTSTRTRRNFNGMIQDEIAARGMEAKLEYHEEMGGRLMYSYEGKYLTPGEMAEVVGVVWL